MTIDLLRPFDAGTMTAWKVDKAVGNVKNDNPELIEPDAFKSRQCGEFFDAGRRPEPQSGGEPLS
jgi:hypothetical protein